MVVFVQTTLASSCPDEDNPCPTAVDGSVTGQLRRLLLGGRGVPKGAQNLVSLTLGNLYPDYASSPVYAQAASGSGSGGKTKKDEKQPSPLEVASLAAPPVKKGPPSLPAAHGRVLATRETQAPHLEAPAMAATSAKIIICVHSVLCIRRSEHSKR